MKPLRPTTTARRSDSVGRTYYVDISLSVEQLKSFYAGHVSQVSARDRAGVRLQFPLHSLRPFVTRDGVQGAFKIQVSAQRKLLSISRL